MYYHLTVVQPFADKMAPGGVYQKGDHITDPVKVDEVLNGPHQHSVVKRIPHAEHVSGDFYRSDAELAARDAAVKKQLMAISRKG